MNDYYVYVYIDPRSYQEFYFGKGRGSRKDAHLSENSDSEKSKQIRAIQTEGLEPIVRVIARNLSEHDALLVEKTLLWKLGKQLTNISSGHYASNFRPHNSLHKNLSGFDYKNGFYYYNVGENETRCWSDYKKHGFISAGGGIQWRDQILSFIEGDLVAAYLKGKGFVGVGRITATAKPVREAMLNGKPILSYPLARPRLGEHSDSDELSEYIALVEWLECVDANNAKWKPKSGLYTTPLIKASLDNQPKTVSFLEDSFDLSIKELLI
jgi:uncharacterized protein